MILKSRKSIAYVKIDKLTNAHFTNRCNFHTFLLGKAKGFCLDFLSLNCGDAPSTYPEFAEFLVDCGIDSISLSPDAVVRTRLAIAEYEKKKRK
jgi:hypothetical protein